MKPANMNAAVSSDTLADVSNDKSFLLRLSSDEIEAWKAAAKSDGRSLASWIRFHCNFALRSIPYKRAVRDAKKTKAKR